MADYGIVLMTASSHAEAESIAENLVTHKLAACVNILPDIKSFYLWENKFCKDIEILLIAKIKISDFKDIEKSVKEIHSYDVPEVILLPIEDGAKTYLEWIKRVTK